MIALSRIVNNDCKTFIAQAIGVFVVVSHLYPGVDLIKLFWRQFTCTFSKLDHFLNVDIIFLCSEKI